MGGPHAGSQGRPEGTGRVHARASEGSRHERLPRHGEADGHAGYRAGHPRVGGDGHDNEDENEREQDLEAKPRGPADDREGDRRLTGLAED